MRSPLGCESKIPPDFSPTNGIFEARSVAQYSLSPFSDFPVGCILRTKYETLIGGVNVECSDCTRTICAKRSTLAIALSYGYSDYSKVYVSCLNVPGGTHVAAVANYCWNTLMMQ